MVLSTVRLTGLLVFQTNPSMEALVKKVIAEAKLANSSIHGVSHWQTVERNGAYLCTFNSADREVVDLFALFHDCMRENDYRDLEHGPRAEIYLRQIRDWIPLQDEQFENLCNACRTHTVGKIPKNLTVATCWDSDRLDIGRVGIEPREEFLSNPEAKRVVRENDFQSLVDFSHQNLICPS